MSDTDPGFYAFDVFTSPHDSVKVGILVTRWSRVNVSSHEYPTITAAAEVAACLAIAVHGGMATSILYRE